MCQKILVPSDINMIIHLFYHNANLTNNIIIRNRIIIIIILFASFLFLGYITLGMFSQFTMF